MPYSPIVESRQQVSINPSSTFEGNWLTLPTNLTAINDGDDNTATTYGTVGGGPQFSGYWIIDLGKDINFFYSALQWKIAIQNNHSSDAYWGLEYQRLDTGDWVNLWGVHRQASNSGDTIIQGESIIHNSWRKLRFQLKDTGSWNPMVKLYFVRVFLLPLF